MGDKPHTFFLDEELAVAKSQGDEPRWNKLFPLGLTKFRETFPNGKLTFDRPLLQTMADNAKAVFAKGQRIQVNYHHDGGHQVNPFAPLERTVASGWITAVELRDDGLYGLFSWTPRAKKFIDDDEFGYLSPEFHLNAPNRDTGKLQGPTLLGASLTNTPFLKDLPRVAASEQSEPAPKANKEQHMDKAKMIAVLGLAADATDEQVEKAVQALKEKSEKAITMSEADAKRFTGLETQVKLLSERSETLAKENDGLAKKLDKVEAEKKDAQITGLWELLLSEGKVAPAQADDFKKMAGAMGLEAAEKFFKNAPKIVSMSEKGMASTGKETDAQKVQALIEEKISELRKKEPEMKWTKAREHVLRDNPELREQLYA